jgi:hypothetical protein
VQPQAQLSICATAFNLREFTGMLPHATAHIQGAEVHMTQFPDEEGRENERDYPKREDSLTKAT